MESTWSSFSTRPDRFRALARRQNVRNAAIAFANGIADTGSKLALVEFNTTGSVTIPLTPVTSGWVSGAFTTHLNTNYKPNGRTNWQAGLAAAQTVATAKLVVFITDGNPNEPHSGPSNLPRR